MLARRLHSSKHSDMPKKGGSVAMVEQSIFLKKIAGIKKIPTLPEVMQEVLSTVASRDSSASDLATILARDQAMCARVLKMSNSAFYAQNRKISSIDDAVVVLGFDAIVQLMLATTVFTTLSSIKLGSNLSMHGLWKHSMATAVTSKMIAKKTGRHGEGNLAYTAGLLHDIGKLVLANYFTDEYAPVFEKLESEDLFLYEAEEMILGFTHCEIAGWLLGQWNFPEGLINVIISHHKNVLDNDDMNAEILGVRLANILCNQWKIGEGGNTKAYSVQNEDYSLLDLNESGIEEMEQQLRESEQEIDLFLQVIA
jgi:putative nucleotidyltransferase with HDIG domain